MRFIIFTSLGSLIIIFLSLYIFRKFYKKYKEHIAPVVKVASDGLSNIMNEISSTAYVMAADSRKDTFCNLYKNNSNNLMLMNEYVSDGNKKLLIINKSKEYIKSEYIEIKKYYDELKLKAIKMEDIDFYNEIKKYDEKIDKTFLLTNKLDDVVVSKILTDYINNLQK